MGGGELVRAQVRAAEQPLGHGGQLRLEPRGQHRQAHDLYEADVLLLDVVQLRVRVVDAQGVLLRRDVVAQDEVQLVVRTPAAGDRRYRVVRLALRLREDEGLFVRPAAPELQRAGRQADEPLRLRGADAQHGHGPLHDPGLHVLKAADLDGQLHRRLLHGEGVAPALEVVVRQDRAADDGQVRVRADEVVRELPHEVQQLAEAGLVYLHGRVDAVEDDAVFVIIHIGRILHEPGRIVYRDGDYPVVLPCGVVDAAGVALVFGAELAARIVRGGQVPRRSDGARVLFRLREVYGDVELAVVRGGFPLDVLGDAVAADVVGVLAELIVPVRGLFRALRVETAELLDDLCGPRRQGAHEPRIEQVPVDDGIHLQHAPGVRVVHELVQHGGKVYLSQLALFVLAAVQPQDIQNGIEGPGPLRGLDEPLPDAIFHQGVYRASCAHFLSS